MLRDPGTIWVWLKTKQEGVTKPQVLVHVSTYRWGNPFWSSGFLSHSHLFTVLGMFLLFFSSLVLFIFTGGLQKQPVFATIPRLEMICLCVVSTPERNKNHQASRTENCSKGLPEPWAMTMDTVSKDKP